MHFGVGRWSLVTLGPVVLVLGLGFLPLRFLSEVVVLRFRPWSLVLGSLGRCVVCRLSLVLVLVVLGLGRGFVVSYSFSSSLSSEVFCLCLEFWSWSCLGRDQFQSKEKKKDEG
jgi:hypothetical protein